MRYCGKLSYFLTSSFLEVPLTVYVIHSLQRVSILQRLGFANRREMHHAGGMDATVKRAAQGSPMGMANWIWTHNPERYATDTFAKALAHLEVGARFENTNIPKGFKWETWTMEEELEKEKQGITTPDLKLNGDWSIY